VQPIVWRVHHFVEIDSTNSWLVNEAKNAAPEGVVAHADFQTAGRGRLDRQWESPAGTSLLCSILLRPPVAPGQLQLVVAAVALSARAALVRLSGVRPDLKWPNDLIAGDAKLAGLLAEIVTTNEGLAIVVGIGVNLTSVGPANVKSTSVLALSGVTISPRALLDILLDELEHRRAELETEDGRRDLRAEYERSLATLGQLVRVERRDDVVVGTASRVDEVGRLVVNVDGTEIAFEAADVVHVRRHEES
jgi:BirA family biotin operon repressor/biotin-[acetyl-CoA-carboxylase] ligase